MTSPPARRAQITPASIIRPRRVPLIVLSHLRWGFVFQRPQHLLTRLARDFDVFFVEEPVFLDGEPRLDVASGGAGVEVLTPRTPVRAAGFDDAQTPTLARLLAGFAADRQLVEPLVWFYTPMALPLLDGFEPRAVVYDCMDDLASFKFAPPQLAPREAALMGLADIVLTGGPSLYEARKHGHANIHCLPSAVDAAHFAPARLDGDDVEGEAAAALHQGMARPRLGFFGVIDERLDLELVADVADRRPDWAVVMAGPVVKIDPASLPQRPNLRWIGMQRYEALPHLMSHWDVCLLPFALNEATRFISPTKTLEYLAGDKPVVSTRVRDVESLYGTAVRFGADADEFVAAVEQALAETPAARARRRDAARGLVDAGSWDGAAARVRALLQAYLAPHAVDEILLEPHAAAAALASAAAPPDEVPAAAVAKQAANQVNQAGEGAVRVLAS
jgi:glycosyltransferase involved in cell wall biosynthesis